VGGEYSVSVRTCRLSFQIPADLSKSQKGSTHQKKRGLYPREEMFLNLTTGEIANLADITDRTEWIEIPPDLSIDWSDDQSQNQIRLDLDGDYIVDPNDWRLLEEYADQLRELLQ
jgi:hypothetical protein